MDYSNWWLRHLLWNYPNMNVTGLHWWSVNIGSGNGLVPPGWTHGIRGPDPTCPPPQITSLPIVYSNVYLGTNQRKHQSSASLAFVRGIHRWPMNSEHKRPVARKMFPFHESKKIHYSYYQPAMGPTLALRCLGSLLLVYWHGLTLIQTWISNYIHYKVWDDIAYTFPNFNGTTVEVWDG